MTLSATPFQQPATCFQFKASLSTCTTLHIQYYDLDAFATQLAQATEKSPQFFKDTPIVLDLEKLQQCGELDFAKIKTILAKHQLILIGVKNGTAEQREAAIRAGLALMPHAKSAATTIQSTQPPKATPTTKLITHPIRSGTQVYAKGGDLIVTASVSPGAELLADGHIHVYGPLRGRALAGILGNQHARIFCRHLEAELISIAGYYLTREDMKPLVQAGELLQIYLENEQIKITSL